MTNAEPSWGYRFLEAGERTQEGDECRDFDFDKWRPVPAGFLIHNGEGHLYRRPEPQLAYTRLIELSAGEPMRERVRAQNAETALALAAF